MPLINVRKIPRRPHQTNIGNQIALEILQLESLKPTFFSPRPTENPYDYCKRNHSIFCAPSLGNVVTSNVDSNAKPISIAQVNDWVLDTLHLLARPKRATVDAMMETDIHISFTQPQKSTNYWVMCWDIDDGLRANIFVISIQCS